MKDYLGMIRAKASDLAHKAEAGSSGGSGGSGKFDESKVKRDKGGRFSKIEGRDFKNLAELDAFRKKLIAEKLGPEAVKDGYLSGLYEKSLDDEISDEELNRVVAEFDDITEMTFKVIESQPHLMKEYKAAFRKAVKHDDLTPGHMAARSIEADRDALQYGVLGMKWGRRRTDAQIAKDTAQRKESGEKVTPTEKSKAIAPRSGDESPAARYARLTSEAKGGGAKSWDESDLKFYNSRTEAMAKVDKMFAQNPSWLRATSKKVLQQAAQNTMQSVADGVAKKYITTPILDSIPEPKKK